MPVTSYGSLAQLHTLIHKSPPGTMNTSHRGIPMALADRIFRMMNGSLISGCRFSFNFNRKRPVKRLRFPLPRPSSPGET